MKIFAKIFYSILMLIAFVASSIGYAALPVVDSANLAQAIEQVQSWHQQAQQMVQQLDQLQRQYKSLNGARGTANLVNNPRSRNYLPSDYQTILDEGLGQWEGIRDAYKIFGIENTRLAPNSEAFKAFERIAKQAAINRVACEQGYIAASRRFLDIQVLLDKINTAPDAKDISDLQARIQVEQVMMQNEANKLAMLTQLSQAQRDLSKQQAVERRMKSYRGKMPEW